MVFITTTPAIMDSHSLGPRLYLSVILGITSLSLYHLLGKINQHFSGDSAYLPFPAAVSLQTPPSLSVHVLPLWQQRTCSLERFSEALRRAQEDTMDGTSHVFFSTALPIQVCFLQLQPTQPTKRPRGQLHDSLSGSSALSPHTASL